MGCNTIRYAINSSPLCDTNWIILGNANRTADCNVVELVAAADNQGGGIVWPDTVRTDNVDVSFTVTISSPITPPGDGFAVVLGDPSLGASKSLGFGGGGLGAQNLPGVVFEFDDYQSLGEPPAPYFGVTRGERALWENPYFFHTSVPTIAALGQTISHDYVISIRSGTTTIKMDGSQIYSGTLSLPPQANFYVTAGTGLNNEQVVLKNLVFTYYKAS